MCPPEKKEKQSHAKIDFFFARERERKMKT